MSKNHERAEEILNSFDEQPLYEVIQPEDSYTRRLRILHDLEDEAWAEVERGHITAEEAEDAIWACIDYLEGDNHAKGIE